MSAYDISHERRHKIDPTRYRALADTDAARGIDEIVFQMLRLLDAYIASENNSMINEAYTRADGAMVALDITRREFYATVVEPRVGDRRRTSDAVIRSTWKR